MLTRRPFDPEGSGLTWARLFQLANELVLVYLLLDSQGIRLHMRAVSVGRAAMMSTPMVTFYPAFLFVLDRFLLKAPCCRRRSRGWLYNYVLTERYDRHRRGILGRRHRSCGTK